MPPAPSGATIRYGPSRSPTCSGIADLQPIASPSTLPRNSPTRRNVDGPRAGTGSRRSAARLGQHGARRGELVPIARRRGLRHEALEQGHGGGARAGLPARGGEAPERLEVARVVAQRALPARLRHAGPAERGEREAEAIGRAHV